MIRLAWVLLLSIPATVWTGTLIVGAAYLRVRGMGRVCDSAPRAWARRILWASGVRVELDGLEHLTTDAPQVLVANHVSWFDALALVAFFPGPYRFVAKKELLRVPFFGRSAAACGHIFIDRRDRSAAIESLTEMRERMHEEKPTVIMFPEGTRSLTGELQPFKKGAFVLAIQTGADIVPASITGSREIMRKGSWRIRAGTVRITLGRPIPVGEYGIDRRNELSRAAREALLELQRDATQPQGR